MTCPLYLLLLAFVSVNCDSTIRQEEKTMTKELQHPSEGYCRQLNTEDLDSCRHFKNLKPGTWTGLERGEFPHTVKFMHQNIESIMVFVEAIMRTEYFLSHIGASLISDRFLISAAHLSAKQRINGQPHVAALIGSYYLNERENATEYEIVETHFHPEYNLSNPFLHNLALHKLNTSVVFSDTVKPVCLSSTEVLPGSYAIVIAREKKGVLYKQNTTVGQENFQEIDFDPKTLLSIKLENATDMEVTSGEPLLVWTEGVHCSQQLIALQSHFLISKPDIQFYTRVTPYLQWINSIVWPK